MANAGDLYLGDMSGFSRQLDWRHKLIEEDKRSRIEAADQIRNDVLQLGQTVGQTIKQVGAPTWMGGRKMETDGEEYAGLGSGQDAARFEEMKYKVQDKERDYRLNHNKQVIAAGMHNIKMAKAYDLNARWYGQDPVALEKSWSKRHDHILQDNQDAYFAYQKVDKYPSFYSEADRLRLEDIRNASYKSDEQKQTELEKFRATPSVFSVWARDNGLVNTKFVGTYPQATVALRKRMVDMGYLDGDMFQDTKDGGLYTGFGVSESDKRVKEALNKSSTVAVEEIIGPDLVDPADPDDKTVIKEEEPPKPSALAAEQMPGLITLYKSAHDKKLSFSKEDEDAQAEVNKLVAGGMSLRGAWKQVNKKNAEKESKPLGLSEKVLELHPGLKVLTEGSKEIEPTFFPDEQQQKTVFPEKAAAIVGLDTPRNLKLVQREGGLGDGLLYDDYNDVAFPGGFNAGNWAYGKSSNEKKALADRMAVDEDGKQRPELAKLILDFLNTRGSTPEIARRERRNKYSEYSDLREKIKISRQGMLAGVDFASRYNISQLVKDRPWLKDKSLKGYALNQEFPEEFRDMLADLTYRFGGAAFTKSKSLKSEGGIALDYDKSLKAIVKAKTKDERRAALESFKTLFIKSIVYMDEKGTDRMNDIIKSIDYLKENWR